VIDTSRIVVLASEDTREWVQVTTFSIPRRDTRDPHFLIYNDKLFVYTGTWLATPEGIRRNLSDHLGYGICSDDGQTWHGPFLLEGTYGHYVWRAAAYGDRAYLCGRRWDGFAAGALNESDREGIQAAMLESEDGHVWRYAALFTESYGTETAFLFEDDGSVLALSRGAGPFPARICRSVPPYTEWTRKELDRNVGGPLIAKWGGRYLVGGRNYINPEKRTTALYWLIDDAVHPAAELPSGGDNSYPGFVPLSETKGLLSYYSSHEGSGSSLAPSAIYLAELTLA
jgi:hypothetical protein